MRLLLVGIYDTNTVTLAPQIFYALAQRSATVHGHVVETREYSLFAQSAEEIAASIAGWRPDVVMFSCYIWNLALVAEVSNLLDAVVVVGGPQVTGIERELLRDNPGVDIVVTGEGERTFEALLSFFAGAIPLAAVPGITTREFSTPAAPPIDLAALPRMWAHVFERHPDITWVSFETSRGCPMSCGYCTWASSRRMRYYPMDFVRAELDVVLAQPQVTDIYLCDSSLLYNRGRALQILDHIIASGSNKSIRYEFGPDQLDSAVIERLRLLPGHEFNFGLQTINPSALAAIGRPLNLSRFESGYHALLDALPDATVTIDLIYGLPGDNLAGYLRSLDYAIALPGVTRIITNPLIVLPGSRFYYERERHGIVLPDDGSYVLVESATFSRTDMREAKRYSFLVNLVYLNTALRDALRRLARDTGRAPTAVLDDFFRSLPFSLADGEFPVMVPSVREDFAHRNRTVARALSWYPEIIAAFSEYSGHRYDDALARYQSGFTAQYEKYLRWMDCRVR